MGYLKSDFTLNHLVKSYMTYHITVTLIIGHGGKDMHPPRLTSIYSSRKNRKYF